MDPTTSARPPIPLMVIMTAANTVSRASEALLSPPEAMSVTISATSITVTATASTREPNGSPTRWATTSAWWTAARTAPARTSATSATSAGGGCRPQVSSSSASPRIGTNVVHDRTVVVQKLCIHALPHGLHLVVAVQDQLVALDDEREPVGLGLSPPVAITELHLSRRGGLTVGGLDIADLHVRELVPVVGVVLFTDRPPERGSGHGVGPFRVLQHERVVVAQERADFGGGQCPAGGRFLRRGRLRGLRRARRGGRRGRWRGRCRGGCGRRGRAGFRGDGWRFLCAGRGAVPGRIDEPEEDQAGKHRGERADRHPQPPGSAAGPAPAVVRHRPAGRRRAGGRRWSPVGLGVAPVQVRGLLGLLQGLTGSGGQPVGVGSGWVEPAQLLVYVEDGLPAVDCGVS